MTVIGLDLTADCAPGIVRRDATGPTGVITLSCGASFANATQYPLVVAALSEYPDGLAASEVMAWQLLPGTTRIALAAPPAGSYWVLATETVYQENYAAFGHALFVVGVAALAGWGAGDLIGRAIDAHRGRRR